MYEVEYSINNKKYNTTINTLSLCPNCNRPTYTLLSKDDNKFSCNSCGAKIKILSKINNEVDTFDNQAKEKIKQLNNKADDLETVNRYLVRKINQKDKELEKLRNKVENNKPKYTEKNFVFKDRDLLFLKYLGESPTGTLTIAQAKEHFYSGITKSSFNRRMNKFANAGYITKVSNPLKYHNNRYIIGFGPKAETYFKQIKNDKLKELTHRGNTKLSYINPRYMKVIEKTPPLMNYEHDKTISDLRFLFEDNGADYFMKGQLIYNKYRDTEMYQKKPDAIFTGQDGEQYAIEYESHQKKKANYENIFQRYLRETQIQKVLYISNEKRIYNYIHNLMRKDRLDIPSYSKFLIARLKDIKNEKFVFKNDRENLEIDLKVNILRRR